jgi:hypothetical protein
MKIFVSLASVADLHDGDNFRAIVNFIDYAVVSCLDVPRLMTTQFQATCWPRLLTESVHFCFYRFVVGASSV